MYNNENGDLRLRFTSYNDENNLPVELYTTSFPMPMEYFIKTSDLLDQLYRDQLIDDNELPGITLN